MVGTDQLTDERWGPKVRVLAAYEGPFYVGLRSVLLNHAFTEHARWHLSPPPNRLDPTGAHFLVAAYTVRSGCCDESIDFAWATLEVMGHGLAMRLINRRWPKLSGGRS